MSLIRGLVYGAVLLMTLTGCQGLQSTFLPVGTGDQQTPEATLQIDTDNFMAWWQTYQTCQAGTDAAAMQEAAKELTRVADLQEAVLSRPSPLPQTLNQFISAPPTRLAVDPKAMAAACSLYTGQVALKSGNRALATEMFTLVLYKHPEDAYRYYADQAFVGLRQAGVGTWAVLDEPVGSVPSLPVTANPFVGDRAPASGL